jgi:CPA2 family monovalent cation:H+ antiporter-2
VVAAPEPFHARQIVERARRVNPAVATVVRTHSAKERDYLERMGAGRVMMGEHELALSMAQYAVSTMTQDRAGEG